jgi:RNA polymerase sigma-70 factor (ECF subfamily)
LTLSFKHIDYQAVSKLKEGDIEAFDELFDKYTKRLYSFAIKFLKGEDETKDLVQEVFLYIWEQRAKLNPEDSFSGYLFTITYNKIRKHFNKKVRDNAFKDAFIYEFLKQDNNLSQVIDYKFLLEKVEAIIETLPEQRKKIFIKRKYYNLSIRQISEELGISESTVENQITAANKHINNELKKYKLAGVLFFALFLSE